MIQELELVELQVLAGTPELEKADEGQFKVGHKA